MHPPALGDERGRVGPRVRLTGSAAAQRTSEGLGPCQGNLGASTKPELAGFQKHPEQWRDSAIASGTKTKLHATQVGCEVIVGDRVPGLACCRAHPIRR